MVDQIYTGLNAFLPSEVKSVTLTDRQPQTAFQMFRLDIWSSCISSISPCIFIFSVLQDNCGTFCFYSHDVRLLKITRYSGTISTEKLMERIWAILQFLLGFSRLSTKRVRRWIESSFLNSTKSFHHNSHPDGTNSRGCRFAPFPGQPCCYKKLLKNCHCWQKCVFGGGGVCCKNRFVWDRFE